MYNKMHENYDLINRYFLHLSICHTIIIHESIDENGHPVLTYNASSPDELALVNAA